MPFRNRIETLPDETDTGPGALLDTAALIANLDLVVTTDSMLAHLGGALGRPTFVALRRVPDWRWLLDRSTTARGIRTGPAIPADRPTATGTMCSGGSPAAAGAIPRAQCSP